jgi:hypothetical protein
VRPATKKRIDLRAKCYALVGAMLLTGAGLSAAHATASPVGACCLPTGQCVAVNEFDCDGQGGNFIGMNTSCVMIECPAASVQAPVLSILGLVAAVGALIGVALSYLGAQRRAP